MKFFIALFSVLADLALGHVCAWAQAEDGVGKSGATGFGGGAVVLAVAAVLLAALLFAFHVRSRRLHEAQKCQKDEAAARAASEKHQKELQQLADYDELTGLYGRRAFYRIVRETLDAHPDTRYVMVRGDINRFKAFNDAFGTAAGDKLLGDLGAFFSASAPASTVTCRMQADHFVSLWEEDNFHLNDLMAKIDQWFAAYPVAFEFSFCVGIYEIDDPTSDVALMCDKPLLALYTVKHQYGNKYAYYDAPLREKLALEQVIVSGMRAALESEQFVVYFQPQYSYLSGRIVGAEALVRWNHPQRGMIAPDVFIPVFEENGFITTMDHYVWEVACRYLRKWLDSGTTRVVPVSVNISRHDIYDANLCAYLESLMARYRLPVSLFQLEITESAYVENPQQLLEMVRQLKKAGFVIEMDDFGSGYSSLNTLKDVPVDVLKLDLKFLHGEDNARGGNILSSVVRMARWLELPIIAEGVETHKQAEFLKTIGCEYMQGYYFARPMPAPEFEKFLLDTQLGTLSSSKMTSALIDIGEFWNPDSQITLIFNSFVGGAGILEYDGERLEALRLNDNFLDVVRMTRSEYEPFRTNVLKRFPEEDQAHIVEALHFAIKTGREAECEVHTRPTAKHRTGLYDRIRMRLIGQMTDSYLFYALIEDVTDKHTLSQQLDSIMASVPCGIALYEISGLVAHTVYFNDATAALSGCTRAEYQALAGEDAMAMIWPEDIPVVAAEIEKMSRETHVNGCVYRIHHKDGGFRWVQLSTSVMRREAGVLLIAASFIDMTAQQAAQQRLEAQHQQLYSLYNTAPCAIVQYSADAQALFINQTACDILGYQNSDDFFLSTDGDLLRCVYQDDLAHLRDAMSEALIGTTAISCALRVITKQGIIHPIRTSIKRANRDDGSPLLQSAFVNSEG
ncbi:MAG: EAL domain-containing protein [Clostridia bacterium]